jgi:hypothetical protein
MGNFLISIIKQPSAATPFVLDYLCNNPFVSETRVTPPAAMAALRG